MIYLFARNFVYNLLGLFIENIGKSLNLFGIQQQLSIAIGIIMILLVLIPQKRLSKYNLSQPVFRLISKVKSALGRQLKKKTSKTFFSIGFLNGFLPCGLVYVVIFGAIASGSIAGGGLYMAAFGLGTVPLMTGAIYLGNFLGVQARQKIRQLIPVLVILIGI